MELLWGTEADQVLARLDSGPTLTDVYRATLRTLGRIERDPFDPRLRTRQFSTQQYGQLRSTPVGVGDWLIFWMTGPRPDQLTIAAIAETVL